MSFNGYTVGAHPASPPTLKDVLDATRDLHYLPNLVIRKLIVDDMSFATQNKDAWFAGIDIVEIIENRLLARMGLKPGLYAVSGSDNYYLITTTPEVPK